MTSYLKPMPRACGPQRMRTIKLTMQQIKDSPDVDTERPVSRQMETSIFGFYGYDPYWNAGYGMMGGMGLLGGYGYFGDAMPSSSAAQRREEEIADAKRNHDDVHLRSVWAISKYHIHASDGEIGHVENIMIDDTDWSIRYLAVDTKNWWPGRKVLISPRSIRDISWAESLVNLDADRAMVKESPAYDESKKVDKAYEESIATYYGFKQTSP